MIGTILRFAALSGALLMLTACAKTNPAGDPIDATPIETLTATPTDEPTSTASEPPPTPTVTVTPTETPAFPVVSDELIYQRDNTVRAIDQDGQRDRLLLSLRENEHIGALSPDGRYLALTGFSTPSLLDLQSGEHFRIEDVGADSSGLMQLAWTPDSQTLFFSTMGDSQNLWSVSAPFTSIPQVVTSVDVISQTIQLEFVGVVNNDYVLLSERRVSANPPEYRIILHHWRTHAEQLVLQSDYVPVSVSPDGTRLILAREQDIIRVGATTLKAFYTADLTIDEGIQNIELVVLDDMATLFSYSPIFAPDNRKILALRYREYPEAGVYQFSAAILTPRDDGTYDELPVVTVGSPHLIWIARWDSTSTTLVYQQVEVGVYNKPTIWLLPPDGSPVRYLAEGQNPFIVGP